MENNKEEIFKKKEKEKKSFKKIFRKDKEHVAEANQFETESEKNKASHFFQLPKRWVDVTDPFYFKVYNLKTDGIIFLLTSLIIPFAILIIVKIATFFNPMMSDTLKVSILTLGYFVPAIVATIIYSKRDRSLFYGTGLAYYFWPIFSNFGLWIVFGLILRMVNTSGNNWDLINILGMIFQILISAIWIFVILRQVPAIGKKIIKTFAKNWKMLILVTLISAGLLWAISGPLLNVILKAIGIGGTSDNQNSLQSSNSIFYLILMGIYVVLVAPLYEELVYRHLYYTGVGNRIVAFFASAITFAMIHVIQTGDIEHIIPYLVAGFFLSGIFNIARGNVTYSWMTHGVYNLITFILMLTLPF